MHILLRCSLLLVSTALVARADNFDTALLRGKVVDAANKPIAGAAVRWNRLSGAKVDIMRPAQATTDQDGAYELTIAFEKGKPITIAEVFAEAKNFARTARGVDAPLRGGEATTLDFALTPGKSISGIVRLPPPAAQLAAGTKPDALPRYFMRIDGPYFERLPFNARHFFTEPGGRFEIYLPPGEYSLFIGPPTGYPDEAVELRGIKPGQRELVLELPPFEWSEATIGKQFDDLWEAMDRHYSYFFLKSDVDWAALKTAYRAKAAAAKDTGELAGVLREMLGKLHDMHVWIQTPSGTLPTYGGTFTFNGNPNVTLAQLDNKSVCGKFAVAGKSHDDGFGYFLMVRQSEATLELVQQAAAAIGKLHDVPGFIVDLRDANGGNEILAVEIARCFCPKPTVYAKSKLRGGPKHDEFTSEFERTLPASMQPYTKPVVCLIGPGAVSSGEGLVKMMTCLPQVTTVGLPTRGASGNPKPWPLGRTGIAVWFSRWVDLMPDGKTFEGVGIPPDVAVNEPAIAYAAADPTLEKGLEVLRQKVAKQP
jgi:hypothetical protein